jgi:hypothetical protein
MRRKARTDRRYDLNNDPVPEWETFIHDACQIGSIKRARPASHLTHPLRQRHVLMSQFTATRSLGSPAPVQNANVTPLSGMKFAIPIRPTQTAFATNEGRQISGGPFISPLSLLLTQSSLRLLGKTVGRQLNMSHSLLSPSLSLAGGE